MKAYHLLSLIILAVLLTLAQAQQNAYLLEFPLVSVLAPCASQGLSWAADSLTVDCNTAAKPPVYASCACLKNQNSAFMTEQLSTQITRNCGTTATDDISSVLSVFSAYCIAAQPAAVAATTTPAAATAPQITAVPGTSALAPCAAGAWSWAIDSLTQDCNLNAAPTLQASCACLKDQNSAFMTEQLSIQVTRNCGTTATDDISSVYALFSSYCGYAKAVSAAATATATGATQTSKSIPDLTSIPALTSLAPCASTGFSWAANSFSSDCNANAGPTAVASCVCQKDQNANAFAADISTQVINDCGSTAIEDINSALSVFSSYCDLVGGIVGGAVLTVGYSYTGSGAAPTNTGTGGYYGGKKSCLDSQQSLPYF